MTHPDSLAEPYSDEVLLLLSDLTELACTDAIYMLVPREPQPGSLHQGGGTPRGITRSRWPSSRRSGTPMQHLFTLDLVQMPALARWFGPARAAACFMHDVRGEERSGSELEITWVTVFEPTPPLDPAPAPPLSSFSFAAVPAMVPPELWRLPDWDGTSGSATRPPMDVATEYKLDKLRAAVAALHARAGGESIELQGSSPSALIIQFDEAFVSEINLGDAGLAYLYDLTTALFQSN